MTKPKIYSHGMTLKQARNSLGKLPATDFDPDKHLDASKYLPAIATLPKTLQRDYSALTSLWGMLANDQLGDCTVAGLLHAVQASKWIAAHQQVANSNDVAVRLYELLCGYDPADPSTDRGGNENDVLATASASADAKLWMGDAIRAYARVPFDESNLDTVKQTIELFGFAYIGVAMPQAWLTGPDVWELPTTPAASRVEGGHCVIVINYDDDADVFTLVSWGRTYAMKYDAFARYVDEVHAVLLSSWVVNGANPDGLNVDAMLGDFQQTTGQRATIPVPPPSVIAKVLPEVEAVVEHVADDLIGRIKNPVERTIAKDALAGILAGTTAAVGAWASNANGVSIAEIGVAAGVVAAGLKAVTEAQVLAFEKRLLAKIEALLAKHKAGA